MPNPSFKIGNVAKVIFYNRKNQSSIFMLQPSDWEKGQIKVMGNFSHEPKEGEMLQVKGILEKEPWLDAEGKPKLSANGNELYNYVIKNAKIKTPEPMKLTGRVERVLHEGEKSSIALVRRDGRIALTKVYAPTNVKEGDVLIAEGFKDEEPYLKEGKPVMGSNGKPRNNIVLQATSAECREPKEYSGPITRLIAYYENTHDATVLFNPGFKNGKEVKAYINMEEEPVVGANLSIVGVTDNEITEKDGQTYNNLIIRSVSCYQSPAHSEDDHIDTNNTDMDASGDFICEDEESASPSPF